MLLRNVEIYLLKFLTIQNVGGAALAPPEPPAPTPLVW